MAETPSFCLPWLLLLEEKNLLAYLVQASMKSLLINSLTMTKSGLYAEVP